MADGVVATNDDATSCKRYAVDKGYWNDPFISTFSRPPSRKSPEISRGYYARIKGIEQLVLDFLSRANRAEAQLISLGAGFDTLYWRLLLNGKGPHLYVEVDFPSVVRRKQSHCQSKIQLRDHLHGNVYADEDGLHSDNYHLLGVDICDVEALESALVRAGISKERPTLLLAECVLIYLEVAKSRRVITWAGHYFQTALLLNYGPVNVGDRFGVIMMENLKMRMAAFLGADDCLSLDKQESVFLECGWEKSCAVDMLTVYGNLPQNDLLRIERLEMLDERELLNQLLQHYCISWGVKDAAKIGLSEIHFFEK
eukprot:m.16747 g.16747  ORF g.16747 m.16747 type:complete len:312 (+) comp27113_c0_seq1:32-967(+)